MARLKGLKRSNSPFENSNSSWSWSSDDDHSDLNKKMKSEVAGTYMYGPRPYLFPSTPGQDAFQDALRHHDYTDSSGPIDFFNSRQSILVSSSRTQTQPELQISNENAGHIHPSYRQYRSFSANESDNSARHLSSPDRRSRPAFMINRQDTRTLSSPRSISNYNSEPQPGPSGLQNNRLLKSPQMPIVQAPYAIGLPHLNSFEDAIPTVRTPPNMCTQETQTEPQLVELKPSDIPMKTVNQSLIGILECPVCLEFMSPPIHQCRRGHLLCFKCMRRLQICPTCRSRFTNLRNLAMEKVADNLLYPCKHDGCTTQIKLQDKNNHEANCDHRKYKCAMVMCSYTSKYPDFMHHMSTVHKGQILFTELSKIKVSVNPSQQADYISWIACVHESIFYIYFKFSNMARLHGAVRYVGPRDNAKKFMYTIFAQSSCPDGVHRRIEYSRSALSDDIKFSSYYKRGDAFDISLDSAVLLSQDEMITFHVKIYKESSKQPPQQQPPPPPP